MSEHITVFICTDEDTRKKIMEHMGKETMPYANMLSGVTYEQVVSKIEELEF